MCDVEYDAIIIIITVLIELDISFSCIHMLLWCVFFFFFKWKCENNVDVMDIVSCMRKRKKKCGAIKLHGRFLPSSPSPLPLIIIRYSRRESICCSLCLYPKIPFVISWLFFFLSFFPILFLLFLPTSFQKKIASPNRNKMYWWRTFHFIYFYFCPSENDSKSTTI